MLSCARSSLARRGGYAVISPAKTTALRIRTIGNKAKAPVLFVLRCYKRFISPCLPHVCRFEPTCSVYMYQAIQKKGLFRGLYLGVRRLLRCHPFCEGGIDPVP